MSDLSKDNREGQEGSSGEIYNPDLVNNQQQIGQSDNQPYLGNQQYYEETSSFQEGVSSPPPFVEDKKKKYIVFIIAILIFFLLVGAILFFLTRGKKQPEEKKVTLVYWGLWEDKNIMQPIIDDYQRLNPNVTINYLMQNKIQYRERLQVQLSKGEGPDIFRFHNSWLPMFIKDGLFSPLPKTIYSDSDFEETFFPVASADLKWQGNYYGIPLMIDGLMLYYNEDILRGANVSPPKTWIDVQNAVLKLTVKEKEKIITAGIAMGTAENIEHFSDIITLMMFQNGTQMSKSLFVCSDKTLTSCGVEALSFYRKFAELPNNVWDDTLDNSIVAFAQGKVAMIFAPSWQVFTIKSLNPNLNFKTAEVPQLPCSKEPCRAVHWASYWVEGVSAKSKHQKEAWDFLKYLSSVETMKKMYSLQVESRKLFGEPYSRIELAKSLSDNEYLAPLIAEAPYMKSFYTTSSTFDGDTGLNTLLINYLKNAVNSLAQNVSPETALKTADDGFKQVFARFSITSAQ